MTTFETLILLAVIVVGIILALGLLVVGKKLNHIAEQHKSTFAHFDNVVSQLYGIKVEVGQTNGKIDGFIPWAKHLRQKADNLENAWACDVTSIIKLLDEINKRKISIKGRRCELSDEELLHRLYPIDSDYTPPQDVKGVTVTGICQECRGKTSCQFYDVNRTRCFVADNETTNNK